MINKRIVLLICTSILLSTILGLCKVTSAYELLQDNQLTANFTASPTSGPAPLTVSFTDTSTSYDGIVSWSWDFGDDYTSTGQNPTHVYKQDGAYTVALTVYEADGDSASETKVDYITVTTPNQPPIADANGPYSGTEGVAITFDGSASYDPDGAVASYFWDFGDGETSTKQNPTHTYTQDGTYTVTLTVTDDDSATDTDTTTATVADTNPTADFSYIPNPAALTIDFTDQSTSYDELVSWAWDLGDGETSTEQNPTHSFPDDGIFDVTLTVTDADGSKDTITKQVTVRNTAPTADFDIVSSQKPTVDEDISFIDQSSDPDGYIASWFWDFGDGNTSTTQDVTHKYEALGTFIVSLTVTDDDGAASTESKTVTIFDVVIYGLTVSVSGSGSTSPAVGTHTYEDGTEVDVTAYPSSGWTFSHWLLDSIDVGDSNPYTVVMGEDHSLRAVFVPIQHELTIEVVGSGSTDPAPGTHTYDSGSVVSVDAQPNAGYKLDHWLLDGVDVGSDDPYTVTMDADHILHAVFVANTSLPVHNIETGEDFATIQEAIDDSDTLNGHTILVDAGTYYERVVVNKSVSLIGENPVNTIVDRRTYVRARKHTISVTANNVLIKNFTIMGEPIPGRHSMNLESVNNCRIENNNLKNGWHGIMLDSSSNNIVSRNNVTSHVIGIFFSGCSNNTLTENLIAGNGYNLVFWQVRFDEPSHFMHSIDVSNLVDGKPVYYLVNEKDLVINPVMHPQVGFLALINCVNVKVEGQTLTDNGPGLILVNTSGSEIAKNTITENLGGVYGYSSSNNIISGNDIIDNVHVEWTHQGNGLHLSFSSNNSISGNNVTNNVDGIHLRDSSNYNSIYGNNITNNWFDGIYLRDSSNNKIYNNFINNWDEQVICHASPNTWDDGYPSGGNYWGDYTGVDDKSGPNQDQPGSDGIGDSPYVIDENNRDRYPLVKPSPLTLWYGLVNAIETSGYSDAVFFGERSDASDGQDVCDVPKPPLGPPPSLYMYFAESLPTPYDKLQEDWKYGPDAYKEWVLKVDWQDAVSTTVTLSWSFTITNLEYTSIVLQDPVTGTTVDMQQRSSYQFTMDVGLRELHVICSYKFFITELQTGWNLISSPSAGTVSTNSLQIYWNGVWYTWDNAVADGIVMSYLYAWDGTHYVTANQLEPGKGYWLYSYQICELWTETYSPGQGYITGLQTGWNLIGLPHSSLVNLNSIWVYYNGAWYSWNEAIARIIMTYVYAWDETHYVTTDDVVPGKGYWIYAYQPCQLYWQKTTV